MSRVRKNIRKKVPEKKETRNRISKIRRIRARNNLCWIGILEIALASSPEETKNVLRLINRNDGRISDELRKLAD